MNDTTASTKTKSDCTKRPSQKLYVPKHLRTNAIDTNSNHNNENTKESNNSLNESISKMNFDDPSIIGYLSSSSNQSSSSSSSSSNESQSQPTKSLDENQLIESLQSLNLSSNNNHDLNNDSNSKSLSSSSKTTESNTKLADNDNENEWFSLYDETGESLENKVIPISKHKVKSSELETTSEKKIDYFQFETINNASNDQEETLNDEQYGHVIEIYDFPVSFKNENIYNAFKEHIGHQNFDIKWVDDVHCLGIFSSASEANSALRLANGLLKTRPLCKSGPEARAKAQRLLNTLKPYKARPQTTSFVATRLIGASLGINNLLSKEKLKIEKTKLDNARSKHKKEKELKDAIWQGQ